MKRPRAIRVAVCCYCCWLGLLVAAAHATTGLNDAPPRILQEATVAPSDVLSSSANSSELAHSASSSSGTTASASSSSSGSTSSSADEEDRSSVSTTTNVPETSVRNGATTTTESPDAPATDDRTETVTNYRRGSGLDIEGIVGIAVGGVALIALVVAFVRAGSVKRKKQQQQDAPDFGSSTGSLDDVKYVDSFDSPAESSTRSAIAANRKLSASFGNQDLSMSAHGGNAGAAALEPSSPAITADAHDGEYDPSHTARKFSKPQRSMSRHDSLRREPLSPESYLEFAQSNANNNFQQARVSRHSQVIEEAGHSPVVVRFSRRSVQSNDSASDIPMLGRPASKRDLHHPTSPRDIPVLARGSEESVDSIEDEDVEISI